MTFSTPARLYQLAVEQHEFAGGGQMRDAALEIPLAAFCGRWPGQGDGAALARVDVRGDVSITPPLPAVSRPSIRTRMRWPVCAAQRAIIASSRWIGSISSSYSLRLSLSALLMMDVRCSACGGRNIPSDSEDLVFLALGAE